MCLVLTCAAVLFSFVRFVIVVICVAALCLRVVVVNNVVD